MEVGSFTKGRGRALQNFITPYTNNKNVLPTTLTRFGLWKCVHDTFLGGKIQAWSLDLILFVMCVQHACLISKIKAVH